MALVQQHSNGIGSLSSEHSSALAQNRLLEYARVTRPMVWPTHGDVLRELLPYVGFCFRKIAVSELW